VNSKKKHIRAIREDRLYKIAIITLYAVTTLWLYILLNTPPASGYEISIYNAYSSFFWFLFILTIILGIGLTIYFVARSVCLWKYSLPVILLADTVVLFLPTIRNYAFCANGGSDIFAHLARSKSILNTGQILGSDYYPAMHILMTTVDQLSLLDPAILAAIISFVFFILYVLSLFTLGRAVFKDSKAAALLATVGTPLLFSFGHYAFYPFLFALFLFPLIFYLIRKIEGLENRGAYYTCFIILSFFIVFCHPMITLILLLILGILYGYSKIGSKSRLGFSSGFNILNMIAIVGITFAFWYINFKSITRMGESVISALLGINDSDTILTSNLDMINQSGASLFRVIEAFIKIYGPVAIYFVIALLITIYLIKTFIIKRKFSHEMSYVALFLLSIAFGAALTLGYFVVFELIRAASFVIIMATIVCGIGLYILYKNTGTPDRKNILTLITVVVLCTVSIFSVFNVYHSPWTLSPGVHMTEMEKSGIDWFLTKNNELSAIFFNDDNLRTYPTYFQEVHEIPVQQLRVIKNGIPSHFGYGQNMYLSQSVNISANHNSYIVTGEKIRHNDLAYPAEMQSDRKHFSEEDFFRLNHDPTVNKLYVNHELEFWMVRSVTINMEI